MEKVTDSPERVSEVKRYKAAALSPSHEGTAHWPYPDVVFASDYDASRAEVEKLREALALAEPYMSADGFQVDYDHYNMVRRMVRAALTVRDET